MSDKTSRQIGDELRRITHTDRKDRFPISTGVVQPGTTDGMAQTCTVRLSTDDPSNPTPGVMITAKLNVTDGVVLYPADNSTVWVAEVDGDGNWGIVKYSGLASVKVQLGGTSININSDGITINGGGNDGLVNVNPLVGRLNLIEGDINNLKTALAAFAAALAPITTPMTGISIAAEMGALATTYPAAVLTETNADEIKDANVTH